MSIFGRESLGVWVPGAWAPTQLKVSPPLRSVGRERPAHPRNKRTHCRGHSRTALPGTCRSRDRDQERHPSRRPPRIGCGCCTCRGDVGSEYSERNEEERDGHPPPARRCCRQGCFARPNHSTLPLAPLGHDLEGVRKVALHVLHLEGVRVTDLVVRASVVGVLHHDDVAARAPQLDGIPLACQFPTHQPEREPGPAQARCRKGPTLRSGASSQGTWPQMGWGQSQSGWGHTKEPVFRGGTSLGMGRARDQEVEPVLRERTFFQSGSGHTRRWSPEGTALRSTLTVDGTST